MPLLLRICLAALTASYAGLSVAADTINDVVRQGLEEQYSVTALMTGGPNIQLGFLDFNPNDITGLEDDALGNDASIASRQQLTLLTLPFTFAFENETQNEYVLQGRLAYLNEYEEGFLDVASNSKPDTLDDTTYVASLGMQWTHPFGPYWYSLASLNAHVMRYNNKTDFNSLESQALAPALDGVLTNISTQAWLGEPVIGIGYKTIVSDLDTRFLSAAHYLFGGAFNTNTPAHDVEPEAWYWSNGVQVLQPIFIQTSRRQSLIYNLAQIRVGGDLVNPVGSHHYYEAGVGWFIDTSDLNKWVKNLGISANINYGSNFRGGTLSLLYNVQ